MVEGGANIIRKGMGSGKIEEFAAVLEEEETQGENER